jgi:hypothetical protein
MTDQQPELASMSDSFILGGAKPLIRKRKRDDFADSDSDDPLEHGDASQGKGKRLKAFAKNKDEVGNFSLLVCCPRNPCLSLCLTKKHHTFIFCPGSSCGSTRRDPTCS